MTYEQFEETRNLGHDEFAAHCESDPEFEEEYYSWVDYLTVKKLQEQNKPTE